MRGRYQSRAIDESSAGPAKACCPSPFGLSESIQRSPSSQSLLGVPSDPSDAIRYVPSTPPWKHSCCTKPTTKIVCEGCATRWIIDPANSSASSHERKNAAAELSDKQGRTRYENDLSWFAEEPGNLRRDCVPEEIRAGWAPGWPLSTCSDQARIRNEVGKLAIDECSQALREAERGRTV